MKANKRPFSTGDFYLFLQIIAVFLNIGLYPQGVALNTGLNVLVFSLKNENEMKVFLVNCLYSCQYQIHIQTSQSNIITGLWIQDLFSLMEEVVRIT